MGRMGGMAFAGENGPGATGGPGTSQRPRRCLNADAGDTLSAVQPRRCYGNLTETR